MPIRDVPFGVCTTIYSCVLNGLCAVGLCIIRLVSVATAAAYVRSVSVCPRSLLGDGFADYAPRQIESDCCETRL